MKKTIFSGAIFAAILASSALPASAAPYQAGSMPAASDGMTTQVRMMHRHHRHMSMRMHRHMGMGKTMRSNRMEMNSERKENGMSSGGTRPPNLTK